MVSRNADMSDSGFEHASYAVEHAPSRRNLLTSIVRMGRKCVKMTEQFVGAID
jgi:hypothetical protein